MFKDGGGQLHPDADVDLVVDEGDAQVLALVGEPLGAGAARRGNEALTGDLLSLGQGEPEALRGLGDVFHGGVETEFQFILQALINIGEDA